MIAGRGLMIFRLRLAVTTAIQVDMRACMYVCTYVNTRHQHHHHHHHNHDRHL